MNIQRVCFSGDWCSPGACSGLWISALLGPKTLLNDAETFGGAFHPALFSAAMHFHCEKIIIKVAAIYLGFPYLKVAVVISRLFFSTEVGALGRWDVRGCQQQCLLKFVLCV